MMSAIFVQVPVKLGGKGAGGRMSVADPPPPPHTHNTHPAADISKLPAEGEGMPADGCPPEGCVACWGSCGVGETGHRSWQVVGRRPEPRNGAVTAAQPPPRHAPTPAPTQPPCPVLVAGGPLSHPRYLVASQAEGCRSAAGAPGLGLIGGGSWSLLTAHPPTTLLSLSCQQKVKA